jgi:hypothetical protein
VSSDSPDQIARSAYAPLRAAHLHEVRAGIEDQVARVDWPLERIEQYRTERLEVGRDQDHHGGAGGDDGRERSS